MGETALLEVLLKYGVSGFTILGLCIIVRYLVSEMKRLNEEIKDLHKQAKERETSWQAAYNAINQSRLEEVQRIKDERIVDAKTFHEALMRVSLNWAEFKERQEDFLERISSRGVK